MPWGRVVQNPNTQFLAQPSSPEVRGWRGRLLRRHKSNSRHHLESSSAHGKRAGQRESRQRETEREYKYEYKYAVGSGEYGPNQEEAGRGLSSSSNRVPGTRHPAAKQGHGWSSREDPGHRTTGLKSMGTSPIPLSLAEDALSAAIGFPLANPAGVMQITISKEGKKFYQLLRNY